MFAGKASRIPSAWVKSNWAPWRAVRLIQPGPTGRVGRQGNPLDAAVARLRAEGHDIKDEDVARLSPLKDRHINFLGRYLFNIKASGPGHGLRPFRDPDAAEDDED